MTFAMFYKFINIKFSIILCIFISFLGISDRYINYYKPNLSGQSTFIMKSVVQQYRKFIEKNQDLGSSFSVYNASEKIIDIIGGYEDLEFEQFWNRNTISQLFSLSNIIGIISIAHLVDSGHLAYTDLLSKYVPNCHSSLANVTISDILTHQGAMSHFQKPKSITDFRDEPDVLFREMFAQPPEVTKSRIFHKYTLGVILEALVRKIDKSNRSIAQYFNQEIAYPNQIDILIGLPRTQSYRAARIYNPNFRHFVYALGHFDLSGVIRYFFNLYSAETIKKIESTFFDLKGTTTKNVEHLEITISSWNAFSNAASLAKLFNLLFFGTSHSNPILKSQTIEELCKVQSTYFDEIINSYVSFTKGGLMSFSGPKNSKLYGWRDSTGQFIFSDIDRNITVGYITNHLRAFPVQKDFIHSGLTESIYNLI